MLVYALGSLVCAKVNVINFFLIGRVIQAIGAYAFVTLAITFAPEIAPPIGSYISYLFSWRAVFVFLLILLVILFGLCFYYMPETNKKPSTRFRLSALLTSYRKVMQSKPYKLYALFSVFTMATLMAFVTGSPFLFMYTMGISSTAFAWYYTFNAAVLIISSYVSTRLALKYSPKQLIKWASVILFIAAAIMLIIPPLKPWRFLLPMMLVSFSIAVLMPSTMSGLMEPFSVLTASAASLIGFFRYVTAGMISIMAAELINHISVFIPVMFFISTAACLIISKYLADQH